MCWLDIVRFSRIKSLKMSPPYATDATKMTFWTLGQMACTRLFHEFPMSSDVLDWIFFRLFLPVDPSAGCTGGR